MTNHDNVETTVNKQDIEINHYTNEETSLIPFSIFIDLQKDFKLVGTITRIEGTSKNSKTFTIHGPSTSSSSLIQTLIHNIIEKSSFNNDDIVNITVVIDPVVDYDSQTKKYSFSSENTPETGVFVYSSSNSNNAKTEIDNNINYENIPLTNDHSYLILYSVLDKGGNLYDYEIKLNLEGEPIFTKSNIVFDNANPIPTYTNKRESLNLYLNDANVNETHMTFVTMNKFRNIENIEILLSEIFSTYNDSENLGLYDFILYLSKIEFYSEMTQYIQTNQASVQENNVTKIEKIVIDGEKLSTGTQDTIQEKIYKIEQIKNSGYFVEPGTSILFEFDTDNLLDKLKTEPKLLSHPNIQGKTLIDINSFSVHFNELISLEPSWRGPPRLIPPINGINLHPMRVMGPPINDVIPPYVNEYHHMGPPNLWLRVPPYKNEQHNVGPPIASYPPFFNQQHNVGPPTASLFPPQKTGHDVNIVEIPMYPSYLSEVNNMGPPDDDAVYPPISGPPDIFPAIYNHKTLTMGPPITTFPSWSDKNHHMGPPIASQLPYYDYINHPGPIKAMIQDGFAISLLQLLPYFDSLNNVGPLNKWLKVPPYYDHANHGGPPNNIFPPRLNDVHNLGPPKASLPPFYNEEHNAGPPLASIPPVNITIYPPFTDLIHNVGAPVKSFPPILGPPSNDLLPPQRAVGLNDINYVEIPNYPPTREIGPLLYPPFTDLVHNSGPPTALLPPYLYIENSVHHVGPPNASLPPYKDKYNNTGPQLTSLPKYLDELNNMGPPNRTLPPYDYGYRGKPLNHVGPPIGSQPPYLSRTNHVGPPQNVILPGRYDEINHMGPPNMILKVPNWHDIDNHMGPPMASQPPTHNITEIKFDHAFAFDFIGDSGNEYRVLNHDLLNMTIDDLVKFYGGYLLHDNEIPNKNDALFDGMYINDFVSNIRAFLGDKGKTNLYRIYFLSERTYSYIQNSSDGNIYNYRINEKVASYRNSKSRLLYKNGFDPIHENRTLFYVTRKTEVDESIVLYDFFDVKRQLYYIVNHKTPSMTLSEVLRTTNTKELPTDMIPKQNDEYFNNISIKELIYHIEKHIPNLRYRLYFLSTSLSYVQNDVEFDDIIPSKINYHTENVTDIIENMSNINEIDPIHDNREIFWLLEKNVLLPENVGPPNKYLKVPNYLDKFNNMGPPLNAFPQFTTRIHNMGPPKNVILPQRHDEFNHMGPPNRVQPSMIDKFNGMGPPLNSFPQYTDDKYGNMGPPWYIDLAENKLPPRLSNIHHVGPPVYSFPPVRGNPYIVPPTVYPILYPPVGVPPKKFVFHEFELDRLNLNSNLFYEYDEKDIQTQGYDLNTSDFFVDKEVKFLNYIPANITSQKDPCTLNIYEPISLNTDNWFGQSTKIRLHDIAVFSGTRHINLSKTSGVILGTGIDLDAIDPLYSYENIGTQNRSTITPKKNKTGNLQEFKLQSFKGSGGQVPDGFNDNEVPSYFMIYQVPDPNDFNAPNGIYLGRLNPISSKLFKSNTVHNDIGFTNANLGISFQVNYPTTNTYIDNGSYINITCTPTNLHELYKRNDTDVTKIDIVNTYKKHVYMNGLSIERLDINSTTPQLKNYVYNGSSENIKDKNNDITNIVFDQSKTLYMNGLYFNARYRIRIDKIRNDILGEEIANVIYDFNTTSGPIYESSLRLNEDTPFISLKFKHYPISGVANGFSGVANGSISYNLQLSGYNVKNVNDDSVFVSTSRINQDIITQTITLMQNSIYGNNLYHDDTEYVYNDFFKVQYLLSGVNIYVPKYSIFDGVSYSCIVNPENPVQINMYSTYLSYSYNITNSTKYGTTPPVFTIQPKQNGWNTGDFTYKFIDSFGYPLGQGEHYFEFNIENYTQFTPTHFIIYEKQYIYNIYEIPAGAGPLYKIQIGRIHDVIGSSTKIDKKVTIGHFTKGYFQVSALQIQGGQIRNISICDKNIPYVVSGGALAYPTPDIVTGIHSTGGQNSITLRWSAPQNYIDNNIENEARYDIYAIQHIDSNIGINSYDYEITNAERLTFDFADIENKYVSRNNSVKINSQDLTSINVTIKKIPGHNVGFNLKDNAVYVFAIVSKSPTGSSLSNFNNLNIHWGLTKEPKLNNASVVSRNLLYHSMTIQIGATGGSTDEQIKYELTYYPEKLQKNKKDVTQGMPNNNSYAISGLAPGQIYTFEGKVHTNMRENSTDGDNYQVSNANISVTTLSNTDGRLLGYSSIMKTLMHEFNITVQSAVPTVTPNKGYYDIYSRRIQTNEITNTGDWNTLITTWPTAPTRYTVEWNKTSEQTTETDTLLEFNPSESNGVFKAGDVVGIFDSVNHYCLYSIEIQQDNDNDNYQMFVKNGGTGFNNQLYVVLFRQINGDNFVEPLKIIQYKTNLFDTFSTNKITPKERKTEYYKNLKFDFINKRVNVYETYFYKETLSDSSIIPYFNSITYPLDSTQTVDEDTLYHFTLIYDGVGGAASMDIDSVKTETTLSGKYDSGTRSLRLNGSGLSFPVFSMNSVSVDGNTMISYQSAAVIQTQNLIRRNNLRMKMRNVVIQRDYVEKGFKEYNGTYYKTSSDLIYDLTYVFPNNASGWRLVCFNYVPEFTEFSEWFSRKVIEDKNIQHIDIISNNIQYVYTGGLLNTYGTWNVTSTPVNIEKSYYIRVQLESSLSGTTDVEMIWRGIILDRLILKNGLFKGSGCFITSCCSEITDVYDSTKGILFSDTNKNKKMYECISQINTLDDIGVDLALPISADTSTGQLSLRDKIGVYVTVNESNLEIDVKMNTQGAIDGIVSTYENLLNTLFTNPENPTLTDITGL